MIGDPGSWLAQFQDVEERLIARLPAVWPVCLRGLPAQPLEDQITLRLVVHLRRDREARRLGAIHAQLMLLEEQLTGDVVPKGYIDFAIILGENPECYVAFECKRLNVNSRSGVVSLAGVYAEKGMMRYICAQYARELPLGVMIGYVLDGNTAVAEARLVSAITARAQALCISASPVSREPVAFIRRLLTNHHRTGETRAFEIRHALLPYPPPVRSAR